MNFIPAQLKLLNFMTYTVDSRTSMAYRPFSRRRPLFSFLHVGDFHQNCRWGPFLNRISYACAFLPGGWGMKIFSPADFGRSTRGYRGRPNAPHSQRVRICGTAKYGSDSRAEDYAGPSSCRSSLTNCDTQDSKNRKH